METIIMNQKAMHLLKKWDPFKVGEEGYDTEVADVVATLHSVDDPSQLAQEIRRIYEQSYEQWIPFEKCVEMAYQLIAIKFEAKCII